MSWQQLTGTCLLLWQTWHVLRRDCGDVVVQVYSHDQQLGSWQAAVCLGERCVHAETSQVYGSTVTAPGVIT